MAQYREPVQLYAECKKGKWWEDEEKKITKTHKWSTLVHNGLYFGEAYVPQGLSVKYKGQEVKLDYTDINNPFYISAEEAAYLFTLFIDRDIRLAGNKKRHVYSSDSVFRNNFWNDWSQILGPNSIIKDLNQVDFTPILQQIQYKASLKKSKKEMNEAERKEYDEKKAVEKLKREEIKKIYGYAIVDNVLMTIDYTVEPPGLYQGHGNHPLRGKIKKRMFPHDVSINISINLGIPIPYLYGYGDGKVPSTWGAIEENHSATWLAKWKHPVTGKPVQKSFKRSESHFACIGDMNKFELARKLKENIKFIRERIVQDLSSPDYRIREFASAVYLLDLLAIRPGTEKDEEKEADTVGLTTLRCENVKFHPNNTLTLDFSGKSSIKFVKTFQVDSRVYTILNQNCGNASGGNPLFPNVSDITLNAYLKSLMDGLTAKVFRTWKASSIMQEELDKAVIDIYQNPSVKKILFDQVNMKVALALNHKKLLENDERTEKLKQKIIELQEKLANARTEKMKETAATQLANAESKLLENQENVALSTSKLNYIDPRITISWAKKYQMPIEKLFSKVLQKKFEWAMDTLSTWRF